MIRPSRRLSMLGIALGALLTLNAGAEPEAPPGKRPPHVMGPPGHAYEHGKHEDGDAEPGRKHGPSHADGGLDESDHHDRGPDAGAEHGMHHGHGAFRDEWMELRAEIKDGKLKKEDLKARFAELKAKRDERMHAHRQSLKERWGDKLAVPAVHDELARHERRLAMLDRILELAQTEKTGKDKDALTARIQGLISKENARHDRVMQQTPAASASAPTPSASAAPSSSGETK